MNGTHPYLGPALAVSLALHAALIFVNVQVTGTRTTKPPPELTVRLPPPIATPEPAPRLTLPPQTEPQPRPDASAPARLAETRSKVSSRPAVSIAPAVSIEPAAPQRTDEPQRLSGQAAQRAAEQLARDLPYPPEAIERGWQGEALVLIFLDATGDAIAARLEASSGHAILDEAAVRAARGLRALPASAPREALLPVRFRLR